MSGASSPERPIESMVSGNVSAARRRRGHESSTKVHSPANRSSKVVTDYGKYVHQT